MVDTKFREPHEEPWGTAAKIDSAYAAHISISDERSNSIGIAPLLK